MRNGERWSRDTDTSYEVREYLMQRNDLKVWCWRWLQLVFMPRRTLSLYLGTAAWETERRLRKEEQPR